MAPPSMLIRAEMKKCNVFVCCSGFVEYTYLTQTALTGEADNRAHGKS